MRLKTSGVVVGCARVAAVLQCCSHQSAAARGVTLPIITQGSVSQTLNQCRSQYLNTNFSKFESSIPRFKSLLDTVNSSESLNPPPHNTQLMQNKIFTTCKICPAPKCWVVYASGAGWLGWRSEYQDQGTEQPRLSAVWIWIGICR